jgi:hypothetical protein
MYLLQVLDSYLPLGSYFKKAYKNEDFIIPLFSLNKSAKLSISKTKKDSREKTALD